MTDAPLFERLFEEHFTWVWNALRRLGVHEADREDLVQEVFVRVHRSLSTYDESRPAPPWLFAFAFRVASDHKRLARHRVETREVPDAVADAPPADETLDDARRRAMLDQALDALDLPKRAVVVLHELEEMTISEVARVLEIPEGTAASRLRAARGALAAELKRIELRGRRP